MAMSLQANQNNPEVVVNTYSLGHLSKSVAGASNVTLSEEEARYAQITLTGALTANIEVYVPAEDKITIFRNNTTDGGGGPYTVTVLVVGQTGVVVTNGKAFWLGNDGTDTYKVEV